MINPKNLHETIRLNALSTFVESNAEVSIKATLFLVEYSVASEICTPLYSSAKSDLFPTRRIAIPGGPFYFNSDIQLSTFKKLLFLVIS